MIVRTPTTKSRISAGGSILCVLVLYMVEGWAAPPIPSYVPGVASILSIGLLFLAKSIREKEGNKIEIPELLKNDIARYANIEASFALLSGLSVVISFLAIQFNASKPFQRGSFVVSVTIFIITGIASYWSLSNIRRILRR